MKNFFNTLALCGAIIGLCGFGLQNSPNLPAEKLQALSAEANRFSNELVKSAQPDGFSDLDGVIFIRQFEGIVYFVQPSSNNYWVYPNVDYKTFSRTTPVRYAANPREEAYRYLSGQSMSMLDDAQNTILAAYSKFEEQSAEGLIFKDKNTVYVADGGVIKAVPQVHGGSFKILKTAHEQNILFADKNRVYLYNKPLATLKPVGLVSVKSVMPIFASYGDTILIKDAKGVYALSKNNGKISKIVNADPASFKIVEINQLTGNSSMHLVLLALDKRKLYIVNQNATLTAIPGVVPTQFNIVEWEEGKYYGQYKNKIYYVDKQNAVKNFGPVNFATFSIIKSEPWFYYAKDKSHVWFYNGQLGVVKEIAGADAATFESVRVGDQTHFLRDKKNVYYRNAQEDVVVLAGADPKTFEMKSVEWGMYIARDANHRWVYSLSNFDLGPAHSFIVLPSENNESFDALFK